ncbi:cytochrome P450 [Trichoderma aethiopicum]
MAVNAAPTNDILASLSPLTIGLSVILILLLKALHGLTTDRLRHIPGPLIARLTPIWYWYIVWKGIECRAIAALHKKYGPVVRIAPNEVDISDGAAVPAIYIDNGGFLKTPAYRNFDINGFPTIFSVTDHAHRAVRAKAVAPLFAQQAINNSKPAMQRIIDATLAELERRKSFAEFKPVDLLDLFRCMAMDVMTEYLVWECFSSVGSERLSATGFVDSFAAAGRFFHLPNWLFSIADYCASKFHKNRASITTSIDTVHQVAAKVVDHSIARGEKATYQGRLLKAGISREEAIAQVVDIMFAGTDGMARILAVFCWHMAQAPDKYARAFTEIVQNPIPMLDRFPTSPEQSKKLPGSHWQIPLVSPGSSHPAVSKSQVYPRSRLARVLASEHTRYISTQRSFQRRTSFCRTAGWSVRPGCCETASTLAKGHGNALRGTLRLPLCGGLLRLWFEVVCWTVRGLYRTRLRL